MGAAASNRCCIEHMLQRSCQVQWGGGGWSATVAQWGGWGWCGVDPAIEDLPVAVFNHHHALFVLYSWAPPMSRMLSRMGAQLEMHTSTLPTAVGA